ncbi:MAG: DUF971 domain-containing protein [Candidatus Poseidonia sp.]|jgi:DUF971 family protein|nr:DUF971 domain-containing protein [Poseidonia sp.]
MAEPLPTLKKLERRTQDMVLTYDDGNTYTVTYDDLRHACPCAKCAPMRNEDDTSRTLRRQIEALPAEKPTVRTVGKYAISFEWLQGCSSGIYRFERLHDLALRRDPDRGKPYVHGAW